MPTIELKGQTITYSVRQSRRAKRVFIKLSLNGGLEVVYPAGMRNPAPDDLLQAQSAWVLGNMRRLQSSRRSNFSRQYQDGELFFVTGQQYRLAWRESDRQTCGTARPRGRLLEVSLSSCARTEVHERLRDVIVEFYRQLARDHLPRRVAELAAEHGFVYNRLRIKHQKTRWGSCSAKGNLNLNLRLMMAPLDVIDYVIIHELCHLRHLDHSHAFWSLVESLCPDYAKRKAWFAEHKSQLVL